MERIDLSKVNREVVEGHTSKGNQPKWRVGDVWYKADHMGYEALSEVVISRLLQKTNVHGFVAYEPVEIVYDGKVRKGCSCVNFRGRNEELIPLERMHRVEMGVGLAKVLGDMTETRDRVRYTVDFIEKATGLTGVGAYLTELLEVDGFFLNEDRHTNNIALIRDRERGSFSLCPIFDNGLSLLSDLNDYPLEGDLFEDISRVRAKPFSRDFDEQVSAAEELYGIQLKIGFDRHDVMDEVAALQGMYDDVVLRRAEDVLLEQLRKYHYA